MKRPFATGSLNGNISHQLVGGELQAEIELELLEKYWGMKYFFIPVRKTRPIKKRFVGRRVNNKVVWYDNRHNRIEDNYFDEYGESFGILALTHFEGMFTELEYEFEAERFDSDNNVVYRGTESVPGEVYTSVDIEQTVYVEPESTDFTPIDEMPAYEPEPVSEPFLDSTPVSEPEPVYTPPPAPEPSHNDDDSLRRSSYEAPAPAPEPSYDSGDSGFSSDDD